MDDIIGGLTESYCLAPGEDQGMRPPPELDDILIKAFDRRSLITARIKVRFIKFIVSMPSRGAKST